MSDGAGEDGDFKLEQSLCPTPEASVRKGEGGRDRVSVGWRCGAKCMEECCVVVGGARWSESCGPERREWSVV